MDWRRWGVLMMALAFGVASAMGAPAKTKKKVKKPEESKYKMYRVLTDEGKTYRYDERGNPIPPPSQKKPAKKKKPSPPPEDGSDLKEGSAEEGPPPEEKPAGGS